MIWNLRCALLCRRSVPSLFGHLFVMAWQMQMLINFSLSSMLDQMDLLICRSHLLADELACNWLIDWLIDSSLARLFACLQDFVSQLTVDLKKGSALLLHCRFPAEFPFLAKTRRRRKLWRRKRQNRSQARNIDSLTNSKLLKQRCCLLACLICCVINIIVFLSHLIASQFVQDMADFVSEMILNQYLAERKANKGPSESKSLEDGTEIGEIRAAPALKHWNGEYHSHCHCHWLIDGLIDWVYWLFGNLSWLRLCCSEAEKKAKGVQGTGYHCLLLKTKRWVCANWFVHLLSLTSSFLRTKVKAVAWAPDSPGPVVYASFITEYNSL